MATRRKPKAYRDGGAVPEKDAAVFADMLASTTAPEPEPEPEPPAEHNDAVRQALEAQRRAEQMHQAAAAQQQQQPAQMSQRRQRFIADHPQLLDPANSRAIENYYEIGKRRGLEPDSAAMDDFIWSGVAFEQAERQAAQERARRPADADEAEPLPTYPAPSQGRREPSPAMQEPRRSMPMSAPVQREAPSMSGKPRSQGLHLTEEERRIARNSFMDRPDMPHLTDQQKEYLYAQQKQKYQQMVADGSYYVQRQR